jgi:uncharacterized caspase-like protein
MGYYNNNDLLFFSASNQADCAHRVALVSGNANYTHSRSLTNPVNDAKAVSKALSRLGFDVTLANDLKKSRFEQQLLLFFDKVNGAQIALVYYAGHGLELNGKNYLMPIDARLKANHHITFECVPLDNILNAVNGAHLLKLVLLDACRDNPFVSAMKNDRRQSFH